MKGGMRNNAAFAYQPNRLGYKSQTKCETIHISPMTQNLRYTKAQNNSNAAERGIIQFQQR